MSSMAIAFARSNSDQSGRRLEPFRGAPIGERRAFLTTVADGGADAASSNSSRASLQGLGITAGRRNPGSVLAAK